MNQTEHLSGLQYVYEMAQAISFANDSAGVLCENFLPWADIVVSASRSPWFQFSHEPDQVQARWDHASQYLWTCVSSSHLQRWGSFRAFLGGFEYWHTSLREEAHRDLGPFRFVIECHNPLEQIIRVPWCWRAGH